jgi:hypothetical protein
LAFTPNKKRVVCIPPAFFVYLDDDPEIAAHTPLLLFGHVLFLHGREHRVGMGGLEPRPDNRPVVLVGQGGGLSALSLCLDRPEFFYYRNLGVRRRELLGVSCGVDFILCYVLLKLTAAFLYEPL